MTYFTAPGIISTETIFVDYDKLVQLTADFFGVEKKDIISGKRYRHIVDARHFLINYLRVVKKQLLRDIALNMGNRDHTTVIYSITNIENLCKQSKDYFDTRTEYFNFLNLNA
jgi:chromosomal replication initiator protein